MNNLANFLSILSLLFGFISIIFSLEAHFTFASWGIILAVIFDGLDGQVARLNPVPSDFGKELDSLVDAVCFGIAPSVLGYIFIYKEFHLWATIALFIYLFCSVMRLAKYNVTPKDEMANYFHGLPTTVSGGILASFTLIFRKGPDIFLANFVPSMFFILVLILAYLMLSGLRYPNLDGLKELLGKNTRLAVLALVVLLILAAAFKKMGVVTFVLFLFYLTISPIYVKKLARHN